MNYYHSKSKGWRETKNENGEIWGELEEKVKTSIMKVKQKTILWKIGRRKWHSNEWREKKMELRRDLGRMGKEQISTEEYTKKRREYKAWREKEKEKHEQEEEEETEAIKIGRGRSMEIYQQV